MILKELDKYIRLVGGLAGRSLSTNDTICTLDSYKYHGLHTVFQFNNTIDISFVSINFKTSFKLVDLVKLLHKDTHAYYAVKNLRNVLKYAAN